jgi:hypothetical protein
VGTAGLAFQRGDGDRAQPRKHVQQIERVIDGGQAMVPRTRRSGRLCRDLAVVILGLPERLGRRPCGGFHGWLYDSGGLGNGSSGSPGHAQAPLIQT